MEKTTLGCFVHGSTMPMTTVVAIHEVNYRLAEWNSGRQSYQVIEV
jgi:hypothetical protein